MAREWQTAVCQAVAGADAIHLLTTASGFQWLVTSARVNRLLQ